jgi:hypothetical protein
VATNYNPNWGQSGTVNPTFEAVSGSGNNVLAYTGFNYQERNYLRKMLHLWNICM